jgi:hypothetical protein
LPSALRGPCARLRYSFGGDRPSQTARLPRSQLGCAQLGEGAALRRVVFHLSPPPELAPSDHRVPPMLHSEAQRPMTGCSKGAWGLFVLPRGLGILTETAISPSTWSRQCPSRYAIRAGRNLPDKEFRYLRTVIVTAAVYRGFGSGRLPCGITPPLNLPAPGRRQCVYGALRGFARTCVFAKQSLGPILCGSSQRAAQAANRHEHPFFRSYGTIMPSSLTTFHSFT